MAFSVLGFFFKPGDGVIYCRIDILSTALFKALFHVPLSHMEHIPLQSSLHNPAQNTVI